MSILGLKKLEYIDSRNLNDYSALPPESRIDIASFIKPGKSFAELPFTPETGEFSDSWVTEGRGSLSSVDFRASVRRRKDDYRALLQSLVGKKCVWRLTLVSGVVYIIGSPEFVPTFSYTDSLSGQSRSEFSISLHNDSRHGLYIDTAGA